MGWYRVAKLNVEERKSGAGFDPHEEAAIWSRGGCKGVMVIWRGKFEIKIPREVLLELVGEELAQKEISRIEGLSGVEYLTSLTEQGGNDGK